MIEHPAFDKDDGAQNDTAIVMQRAEWEATIGPDPLNGKEWRTAWARVSLPNDAGQLIALVRESPHIAEAPGDSLEKNVQQLGLAVVGLLSCR